MTENKPIIIDGIDVSGCKHYEDHTLYDCNETCEINGGIVCTKCKDNHNCNYKQLKRLEQKLKLAENHIKDLDLMVHNGEERENELEQKLKAKEQECEKLKEENFNWEQINKLQEKYQQTLEEIREKWNEFKKLSPLEICFSQRQIYELDKAINNEVLK